MKLIIKIISIVIIILTLSHQLAGQNATNSTTPISTNTTANDTSTNTTSNTTNATTTNTTQPVIPVTPVKPVVPVKEETNLYKIFVCDDKNATSIHIGQEVTICIHFYERKFRMAYRIVADEYTVVSIGGAYNLASSDKLEKQSFLFQVGKNMTDTPALFYSNPVQVNETSNKFIIPVFNIVIKVKEGEITEVVWDNDCFNCFYGDCYTNNNQVSLFNSSLIYSVSNCKQAPCTADKANVFNCDPKFYITWFGTDKDKKQMKSSNLSMSRFRQYSIGSLYNSAKDAFNKTIGEIVNTYNDVKTKTEEIIKGLSVS